MDQLEEIAAFDQAEDGLPELPRATALESQAIIQGRNAEGKIVLGMIDPRNGPAFDAVVRATEIPRREFEKVQIDEEEFQVEFQIRYRSEGESEALGNWNIFGEEDLNHTGDLQWAYEQGDEDEDEEDQAGQAHSQPARGARTGTLDKTLRILEQAQGLGASDIHFMPMGRKGGNVLLRIDGHISPHKLRFKRKEFKAMVNTIITRANLTPEDIERLLSANSKVKVNAGNTTTEYRASFFATELGIAVVLRLNVNVITDMNRLGFEPDDIARLRLGMNRSKGIILMVGPTGAGKSNTMEAMITEINDGSIIVYQIGDPNEFIVPGRYQIRVANEEELEQAYQQALRSDPDIICPGEIRSAQQATQAIKGAQTGHLVMSTLHAGSASEAVSRLIGLGVDPYYLSDFLIMVIGQRLIPKLCRHCRIEDKDGEYLQDPQGCKYCLYRGVYDRQAICEILLVTPAIKQLIRQRAPTDEIEQTAREEGMRTMQEVAERKIKEGIVSRQSVKLELGEIDLNDLTLQPSATMEATAQ